MAPFNLSAFDRQGLNTSSERVDIVDRLVMLAEVYLGTSSREREAAGVLIARLLTRKDVNKVYIPMFLTQAMSRWHAHECTTNYRIGLLTCLCEIYKIGNRDVLLAHVDASFAAIREMDLSSELASNTLLRKLRLKFAQRLSLSLFHPNGASWRYKANTKILRGSIELNENITEDPPESVEDTIAMLIEGLQDRDTVVRYSAAKGIGRITSRLPEAFASEVTDAICDLLSTDIKTENAILKLQDYAKDSTWHGAALAIAELCRNSAMVLSALHDIMPFVFVALTFDIKKGSHSIGTSVRDAACYVLWSVLRAFQTPTILPFMSEVAKRLIVVALFDREISVRRAASAAFQEGVGRHADGAFPDGIAVLSKADFSSVGQRRASFLEVSPDVFYHSEYQTSILNHLLHISCVHWDKDVRELAGQTLGKIMLIKGHVDAGINKSGTESSEYTAVASVLSQLTVLHQHMQSVDTNARHGALYAVGEICSALRSVWEQSVSCPAGPEVLQDILTFGLVLPEQSFGAPTAPLMYQAICHYIALSTMLETALHDISKDEPCTQEASSRHDTYLNIAIGAFSLHNEQVRKLASTAIAALYKMPHVRSVIDLLIFGRTSLQSPHNPSVLKGWLTFLGEPQYSSKEILISVLQVLLGSTKRTADEMRDDPETRKIALRSIGQLLSQLDAQGLLTAHMLESQGLLQCLDNGLHDYTIDSRGDIGSQVREATVTTTCHLLRITAMQNVVPSSDQTDAMIKLCADCIAQCLGKIDNLRIQAVREIHKTISEVFGQTLGHTGTPLVGFLFKISSTVADAHRLLLEGESSLVLFRCMLRLLEIPELRATVLSEYLITGTSGSQSTMTVALSALTSFLDSQSDHMLVTVITDITALIDAADSDDRVLVPTLYSLANLLDAQIFGALTLASTKSQFDFDRLFTTIQSRTLKSANISKISAALKCYAALATMDHPVKLRAWKKIAMGLGHQYPNVRVMCAELGYQVISNLGIEEESVEVQTITDALTSNDWSTDVDKAQLEIVNAFNIP